MTSHPVASCETANGLYWRWAHLTEVLPQYHHDCQDAKAEYMLHLWECDKCTALLNKCNDFVREALDDKA